MARRKPDPERDAALRAMLGRAYGVKTVSLRGRVVGASQSGKGVPHGRLDVEIPVEGPDGPMLAHISLPVAEDALERFQVGEAVYVEVRRPER